MASKIHDLPTVTSVLSTDITNIVNSPFTPGSDKQITMANFASSILSLGSGITGSGVTNQVAYFSSTSGIAGSPNFLFDNSTGLLTLHGLLQFTGTNALTNSAYQFGVVTGGNLGINGPNGISLFYTVNGVTCFQTGAFVPGIFTQAAATGGTGAHLYNGIGGAHTAWNPSNTSDVIFNLARTVQFTTGNLTEVDAFIIQAPTYAFVGASTITTASTLTISGAPITGTNATITNAYALDVQAGTSRFGGSIIATSLGLGTSAATDTLLNGVATWSVASTLNTYGLNINTTLVTSTNNSSQLIGIQNTVNSNASDTHTISSLLGESISVNHENNTVLNSMTGIMLSISNNSTSANNGSLNGITINMNVNTSGTTSEIVGLSINSSTSGTGTITSNQGLYIAAPFVSNNITSNYGIYIDDQTGTGTSSWALYVAGGLTELQTLQIDSSIGFFGTTPQTQQTSGTNLTNSVTSGGTTGTIANFTSLSVYATDATTIRNDIYQLALMLGHVNNALRTYGLLT